ncbi:MAG TPA: glycerophosphodiester phosphodiesterase [Gaiellaceae bacterium]|jgi:glycerophosphoryl diester phosphodiesterase|nr:glycerophosphodiester phosphodiesterase [Gaiellaceae bacterium]
MLRIGHRGAARLAPANTLAAIEAALAVGIDAVELDVLSVGGRVVLSHSARELASEPVTLDDALELLAQRAPETLVVADMKVSGPAFERDLVDLLRRHEAVPRALAASGSADVLRRVQKLEPALATSLTYPRGRFFLLKRLALPFRIAGLLEAAGASATTLRHPVISRPVVERCHELGVPVLAWTVNRPSVLARLDALGVDGVITDDPRIFPTS